jgi:hypothetical protein
MQRNPSWKPTNKQGNVIKMKTALKKGELDSNPYRQAKLPWILNKYDELYEKDVAYMGKCVHDEIRALKAFNYVNGISTGGGDGAFVKKEIVYDENICTASRVGYYLIRGSMAYLHTDGSLCRVIGGEATKCSCGYVHMP